MLDYYLIRPGRLLVEEFTHDDDHTSVALAGTLWTGTWGRPASPFSRTLRSDPNLLARTEPLTRTTAAATFAQLTGYTLPSEPTLRAAFGDPSPLSVAAPLRLGPPSDSRHYRVLFAKQPHPPAPRTGRHDTVEWTLRPVGNGIAWALDVTLHAAGDPPGPVLRHLTAAARALGLIPVTTERFT